MRTLLLLGIFFAAATALAGENETGRFLGPEADWKYARLELRDLNGLGPSLYVAICGSGSVSVREIDPPSSERRFAFTIPEKDARALLALAVEKDVLSVKPPARAGIPDEGRPIVALESPLGLERSVYRWRTVSVPALEKVENALLALVKKTEKLEPVYQGKPDGFFRPFEAVVATVAIYSGRPDPSFELVRPEDWEKLRALTKDLTPTARPVRTAPPLGYRGFLLAPRRVEGLPRWLSVQGGVVQSGESPRAVSYAKDDRALESWLKEEAKKRGIEIPK